jgi:ATP-dependent Clp endopeptidase proteolytic subunit ClpP
MNFLTEISPLIKTIELKQDPIIVVVNEFNEEAATEFSTAISLAQNTGQKVVPVVIDSYGGQVYSLMSMISSIKSSTIPVATIVQGKAMSCGAILASFGTDGLRFMDKDATLMIHDVSTFAFGKIEELKADAREAERLNKKVYTMMARNCGKPDDYFSNLIHDKGHADWFLDAEEAKEHNIVQHLRVPQLKASVTVEIDME